MQCWLAVPAPLHLIQLLSVLAPVLHLKVLTVALREIMFPPECLGLMPGLVLCVKVKTVPVQG